MYSFLEQIEKYKNERKKIQSYIQNLENDIEKLEYQVLELNKLINVLEREV